MESFIIEVVTYMQPPSADADMVLFADADVHSSRLDVRKYLPLASAYAKKYNVYLISGLLLMEGALCMCLFAPTGDIVFQQKSLHTLIPSGYTAGHGVVGDTVHVMSTAYGNIAFCVDDDAFVPQVARAAALKGADAIFMIQKPLSVDLAGRNIHMLAWDAAQTNNLYVTHLAGGSCVVACPAMLTRRGDGFLVRRTRTVPLRFGFNMRRLAEVRKQLPLLQQMNRLAMRACLEQTE